MMESRFVTCADGARVHYRVSGRGDPVLLVHGIGSTSRTFGPLTAQLDPVATAIAIDLRGYGASDDRPLPRGWQTFAGDIATVLDHANAIRVHVVGASAATPSVLTWCRAHPDRLRSLTLVGPTLGDAGDPQLARRLLDERRRAGREPRRGAPQRAARMAGSATDDRALRLLEAEQARIRPAGHGVIADLLARTDAAPWLTALRAPVQVIVGEDDVITGGPVADRVREYAPHARMVSLPGAGHSPHVDMPAQTASAIRSFLAVT